MAGSKSEIIKCNLQEHGKVLDGCMRDTRLAGAAETAAKKIIESLSAGGKIMVCGNGGSASDSEHLAAEFINKYRADRKPLPAISLVSNASSLTAIGNDYSFDFIFSKQVEALGKKEDILIGISTSGKSKNVLLALEKARDMGIYTIFFTGSAGNYKAADLAIAVPSDSTPRIQEIHLVIYHSICEIVESELFGE